MLCYVMRCGAVRCGTVFCHAVRCGEMRFGAAVRLRMMGCHMHRIAFFVLHIEFYMFSSTC